MAFQERKKAAAANKDAEAKTPVNDTNINANSTVLASWTIGSATLDNYGICRRNSVDVGHGDNVEVEDVPVKEKMPIEGDEFIENMYSQRSRKGWKTKKRKATVEVASEPSNKLGTFNQTGVERLHQIEEF